MDPIKVGLQRAGVLEEDRAPGGRVRPGRLTFRYSFVRVADPLRPIEDLANILDDRTGAYGRAGRQAAWMRRQTSGQAAERGALDPRDPVRGCCALLANSVQRRLHVVRVPSRHECAGCGTTWALVVQPEGARR